MSQSNHHSRFLATVGAFLILAVSLSYPGVADNFFDSTTTVQQTGTLAATAAKTTRTTIRSTTRTTSTTRSSSTQTTQTTTSSGLPYSSSFETSVALNAGINTTNGATVSLSSQEAHTGTFSQYDAYVGPPIGVLHDNTRAYAFLDIENPPIGISAGLLNFRIDLWIYVPSSVNGEPVYLRNTTATGCAGGCGWISFMTINTAYLDGVTNVGFPITVDSFSDRALHLWVGNLQTVGLDPVVNQTGPSIVAWPFDTWWELSVICHLTPPTGTVTVLFNNAPIINYSGLALTGPFWHAHFGLYINPWQDTFAVYNDDLLVSYA